MDNGTPAAGEGASVRSLRWAFLVGSVLLWGWASAAAESDRQPSQSAASDFVDELGAERALFDESFDQLMKRVPDAASDDLPLEVRSLSTLKTFRRDHVRWLALRGNTYSALESGSRSGGWLAIIPDDVPSLSDRDSTLMIDRNPDIHVVRIRPGRISRPWAGLFLLHEVSHLLTRINRETPNPETRRAWLVNELRAYNVEFAAADFFCRGGYRKQLDSVLADGEVRSLRELIRRSTNADGDLTLALDLEHLGRLNGCISRTPAVSQHEEWLRSALHLMSLMLRVAELESGRGTTGGIVTEIEERLVRAANVFLLQGAWDDDLDEILSGEPDREDQ